MGSNASVTSGISVGACVACMSSELTSSGVTNTASGSINFFGEDIGLSFGVVFTEPLVGRKSSCMYLVYHAYASPQTSNKGWGEGRIVIVLDWGVRERGAQSLGRFYPFIK